MGQIGLVSGDLDKMMVRLSRASIDNLKAARAALRDGQAAAAAVEAQVSGKASSEPLYPDDPYMAGNRRISIVLLREAPVLPPGHRL